MNITIGSKTITLGKTREGYDFKWHAICDSQLLESDLVAAQTKMGFDPSGYGFYQPIYSQDGNGRFHARWESSTSSD